MKIGIRDKILIYGKFYFPLSIKESPLFPLKKDEKLILELSKLLLNTN